MANKPDSVIIGWGVVGKSTGKALGIENHLDIKDDKSITISKISDILGHISTFILCLPTPTVKGVQDLTIIESWLKKIAKLGDKTLVIIRSTILPGTTEKLSNKYGLKIVYIPEFLTELTALEDAKHPEFLIIGGDDSKAKETAGKLFAKIKPKHSTYFCTAVTAEVLKYTFNSWFAMKVIFANQIFDVCGKTGAAYGAISQALEDHKWGSKNGWDIWQGDYRGYGGKCLPKDVEAFSNTFELPLLTAVQWINNKLVKMTK